MRISLSAIWLAGFFLLLFAASCSKTGPRGATGATGATGPAGPVGPAGANGTVIYSGTTIPAAAFGDSGDYYLDLSTDVLYGPKTASGWGSGILLVGTPGANGANGANGASGANGAPGSQIYSGDTIPDASLGNVGDYYLDDSTYVLYGPKTASGWGTGIVLKGASGTDNMIYSAWNVATDSRDTVIDGSELTVATLAAASLSATDLNTADIQVYFTFGSAVFPLPYTSYSGGAASTISFIPQVGQILITRFTLDNSNSTTLNTALQYRFVIVPGGVSVPDSEIRQLMTR